MTPSSIRGQLFKEWLANGLLLQFSICRILDVADIHEQMWSSPSRRMNSDIAISLVDKISFPRTTLIESIDCQSVHVDPIWKKKWLSGIGKIPSISTILWLSEERSIHRVTREYILSRLSNDHTFVFRHYQANRESRGIHHCLEWDSNVKRRSELFSVHSTRLLSFGSVCCIDRPMEQRGEKDIRS